MPRLPRSKVLRAVRKLHLCALRPATDRCARRLPSDAAAVGADAVVAEAAKERILPKLLWL
jgi:hypothetical protein